MEHRSSFATWVVVLVAAALSACVADEQVAKQQEALSVPGPWVIPPETLAIGDLQYVPYTGAGAWTGSGACSGSMTEGARRLREWLAGAFPQIESIGGYSCRAIVGDSSRMSVHGTGRALDIMLPLHAGDADNDLGDPIGEWLIANAEDIGIQYIIWDRWTWMAARSAGSKDRVYGGTHPHHDHLHIELSIEGGNATTPWFDGPMTSPEVECDALPSDGGVVDETSSCFRAFGPATYWRHVEGEGHGGSLLWTNAFESDSPSNWARWHLNPSESGDYSVQAWAEPGWGVHGAARYTVRHAGRDTTVEVDQSAGGWIELGVFDFEAGPGQHVSVYDDSPTPVEPEQHIAADAIRLVRADGTAGGGATEEPSRPATFHAAPMRYPVPRIDGGDPTLDDDPLPDDPRFERATGVQGGCTAAGGARPGSAPVLGLLLAALLLRRRRR